MAISTKAELKTEASAWVDDPQWFSGRADNLLALAEARLNRALKGRLAVAAADLTGTVDSREIALPSGYASPLALWLTTTGERETVQPYTGVTLPYKSTAGTPCGYAILSSNIVLDRPCDQEHTFILLHREKFSLEADGDTNWLLSNWPDAYLSALMVETYAFKQDAEATAIWNQRFRSALDEINATDTEAETLAPLNVDPALVERRYSYNDLVRGV